MPQCTFCACEIGTGYGLTLFKRDGTMQKMCSRKCGRHLEMKRNPLRFKWTAKLAGTQKSKAKKNKAAAGKQ